MSTWEEKPQQIWFSWDTEEANDELSPPPRSLGPAAADATVHNDEVLPSDAGDDKDVSYRLELSFLQWSRLHPSFLHFHFRS